MESVRVQNIEVCNKLLERKTLIEAVGPPVTILSNPTLKQFNWTTIKVSNYLISNLLDIMWYNIVCCSNKT